jgi:flagellar motor switch protein FliG
MLGALDDRAPESAERIRGLMFTFEDLGNLLPSAIQVVVRNCNKRELALALKGAPEDMRRLFFGAMTERAAKLLRDDMAAMGPVRARECEAAQGNLVALAKDLGEKGEILLADPKSDDAMIY